MKVRVLMNLLKNMVWVIYMSEYQIKKSKLFDIDIERLYIFLLNSGCSKKMSRDILNKIYLDLQCLKKSPRLGLRLANKINIPNDYYYFISNNYIVFYKIFDDIKEIRTYRIYHKRENYLTKLFY